MASTDSIKPVKVSCQFFWAQNMKTPNKHFDEDNEKMECTVGMLSDKAVAALTNIGIKVKQKDIMGHYVVGKSKYVFEPVDAHGMPVNIDDIGNGSKGFALVSSYRHKLSSKHGAAPSVLKVVVTELVSRESTVDEAEEAL